MSSFLSKLDLAVRYHESIGEQHMAYYLQNQLEALRNITQQKKEYLVASYYVPGELLELLDVEVIYMERLAGLAAAWRILDKPVSRATAKGFPACSCSYQALFDLLITESIIPKPAGFVALSYTCDDAWRYCKSAAAKYNVPFYFIYVPKTAGEEQQKLFAKQLKALYRQLKKLYPTKITLEEVISASNEAQKIKSEIDAVRLKYPGNVIDFFKLFPLYNDLGKKSTVEILKHFKSKLECSSVQYDKDIPRILWLGVLPLYRNSIISDIEKKLGYKVVCEEMFNFSDIRLAQDTFFKDLAQRIMCSRFFTLENRIEAMFNNIRDFGIRGIIHFSQRNCRFLPPMVPSIREKAEEERLPFIEISGDVVDPDFFDENKAWEQLNAFDKQIHGRA